MGPLRHVHISRPVLVALACVSALATVVILHTGSRRTPAQTAALAALAARTDTVTTAAAPVTSAGTTVTSASAPPATHRSHPAASGGGNAASAGSPAPVVSTPSSGGDGGEPGTPTSSPPATSTTTPKHPNTHHSDLPKVDHVFMVVLSTPSYRAAFGAHSKAPYLRSLVRRGTLLTRFESLGRGELADELALVSGQAPNRDTARGCPTYRYFPLSASVDQAGDATGVGCVYPDSALTVGDQVTSDGHTWDAYIADMGKTTCAHPDTDAPTDAAIPGTGDGYDLDHNPFVFFDSLLEAGGCQAGDRDLSALPRALARPSRTPRLAYVAPDACADGNPEPVQEGTGTTTTPTTGTTPTTTTTASDTTTDTSSTTDTTASGTVPMTGTTAASTTTTSTTTAGTTTTGATAGAAVGCPDGQLSGIPAEDAFARQWVTRIMRSAAYRSGGVLVVAFAGSRPSRHAVRTGALVLSRRTPRGARIATAAGPYALLRSIDQMLGDTPLAHAAKAPSLAARLLSAG